MDGSIDVAEHATELTTVGQCGSCCDEQGTTNMESTTPVSSNKAVDYDGEQENQCGSSKYVIVDYETDSTSSTCSSCSTRRNSFSESSDFEITFSSLFRTPSSTTTSHSSNISSPIGRNSPNVLEGIDSLLHRITSERFAELRNIQLSERPVTNGYARENIETFFRRAVHGLTEEERHLEEDANRPAHVISDVQLLQQQSLVQSTLHNNFRSILERTLLSRIPSQQPSQQTSIPVQNVPQRQRNLVGGSDFRARLESLYGGRSTGNSTAAVTRSVQRPASTPQQNVSTHPTVQQRNIPPPPAHPMDNASGATSSFGVTIDAGMQILAQNIADDLNRLQSLQVVSNMLSADFRNDLETMVQHRIANETIGNQTEQFIRSLPGRRPNGHSTTRPSYQQSQATINAGVSAELDVLKNQMDEMKRMLAMSMEIQMDTQRAVRQEVAAIFSTFMQDYLMPRAASAPATQPTVCHPPISTPVASGQCVICIDRSVDAVLYQCGHMCVCNQCGLQLKMDGHNCPMCRAPIRDVIRAYQTQ